MWAGPQERVLVAFTESEESFVQALGEVMLLSLWIEEFGFIAPRRMLNLIEDNQVRGIATTSAFQIQRFDRFESELQREDADWIRHNPRDRSTAEWRRRMTRAGLTAIVDDMRPWLVHSIMLGFVPPQYRERVTAAATVVTAQRFRSIAESAELTSEQRDFFGVPLDLTPAQRERFARLAAPGA